MKFYENLNFNERKKTYVWKIKILAFIRKRSPLISSQLADSYSIAVVQNSQSIVIFALYSEWLISFVLYVADPDE